MSALEARIGAAATAAGMAGWCVALAAPGRRATILGGEDWPGSGRPVAATTRFHAASTGKHLTAVALLDLAAAGRIDLDAPIGAMLPDVPAAWADRTARQLLTHTSGLPEYLAYTDDEPVPTTRAGFFARYAALAPIAAAGETWGYSNTNYILLGFLIAQAGGRSFAATVEAAGAPGLRVASPDWVRAANAAGLPGDACDADSAAREVIGDGDIAFTPAAARDWLDMLLARDARDPLFAPARLTNGDVAPYACGWFAEPLGDARIVHHAGHFDGWTAMALLNLRDRAGVIALCNLAPGSTRAIRALAQMALEDFSPGATPLGLSLRADDRPDLTAIAQRQIVRGGASLDRAAFAPAMQATIDRAGPVRGVLDLWAGRAPDRFVLVDEHRDARGRWRRYRLCYPDRIEHLLIGTDREDRITWAWPL